MKTQMTGGPEELNRGMVMPFSASLNAYREISNKLISLLGILTYLYIFFVLTGLRWGGDLKYFLPYLSFFISALILLIRADLGIFKSRIFQAIAAYVSISYLLIPFSFSSETSFSPLNKEILAGLLLFFTLHVYISCSEKIESIVYFLVFMLLFMVLLGCFSFISGNIDLEIKLIKFKMHHNVYAWILNVLLPFAIAAILYMENRLNRFFVISIAIISIFAIFMSLSRGGWVSLIITSFLWSIYFGRNFRSFLISWIVFLLSIVMIALTLWLTIPAFKVRVFSTTEHIKTITGRTDIWDRNIKAIKMSPIVGWGYGDKIVWDGKPFVVEKEERKNVYERIGYHPHSMVLNILFHQGIIGFLFFAYLIVVSFMSIGSAIRKSRFNRDQKISYAVLCVFISVFVVHGTIEVIPFSLICLVLGFLSGINGTANHDS